MRAALLFVLAWAGLANAARATPPLQAERYVAIGDSYSIGEGARPSEAWPELLTRRLRQTGVSIDLIANPSRTGWTTSQAIERELPVLRASAPTFATVQIGVNDLVQGVSVEEFRRRLDQLLDAMQEVIPTKIILVTIPDFSVTPAAAGFGDPEVLSQSVAAFNRVILDAGARRKLPTVDVSTLSREMGNDVALRAADGLHPSALEYEAWARLAFPVAREMLSPSGSAQMQK